MTIHTFGDSHSINGWWGDETFDNFNKDMKIHWIGAILCYSFGNNNKKLENELLKLKKELKDEDSIVFCFGEIDCRCHIVKYVINNNYGDIIDNIVRNYINRIKQYIKDCNIKFKNICIYNVVPPIRKEESSKPDIAYPYLGTNVQRRDYALYFNKILRKECENNNYIFFDIYDKYSDSEGYLDWKSSDGHVHLKRDLPYLQEFINKNLM